MPSPGQELSSIDFKSLIGGPLIAVVNAQAQAAMTTVNFIKDVGFQKPAIKSSQSKNDAGQTELPVYVTFKYPKEIQPYKPHVAAVPQVGTPPSAPGVTPVVPASADYQPAKPDQPAEPAKFEEMSIQVPILTIVPIPYLRVEEVTIDFNAKIDAVESLSIDNTLQYSETVDESVSGGYGGFQASIGISASISDKQETSAGYSVTRSYSLSIHVKAVQDEMPAGMTKVLGILEKAMTSYPTQIGAPQKS